MASVPLGTGQIPVLTFQALLTELFAYSGNNVVYHGWAVPGSATTDAVWLIAKLTYDSSDHVTSVIWANSKPLFNAIWDNRASLSYG